MRMRWGAIAFVVLLGCEKSPSREDRVVQRWLLCEECVEGELDSVYALGVPGQEAMIEALKGPPQDRLENTRSQIETMYERIQSPGTPRQRFIDHYLSNYKALYYHRARIALARFNSPEARAALIEALRQDTLYRNDVLRGFGQAAGVVVSVFAGDTQHAELDSFVRVEPTVLVQDTTSGNPLGDINVVFRIDSGGGSVVDSSRRTRSDGTASTRWKVGSADSVNVLRATAAGQVVRFKALGHPPGPRLVFQTQPILVTAGQPLSTVRVAVQDAWGATLTNFNQNVVVRVIPTNTQMMTSIVDGVATLTGLTINQAGTDFRLRVTSIGATPAQSGPFNVVAP